MAIGTVMGINFTMLGSVGSVSGGSDCVPKKFWDSEAASVVGGLGAHSFSLFNFTGFQLWEIMVRVMF
jgi:hypothetical protein